MSRRLQFSLKTLLVATALLAAVLSLSRRSDEESVTRIPIDELGKTHILLGKTHQPLGEVTTLTGIVLEGPSKGHDDGPNVRVQHINGQATQEVIHLQLVPYLSSFNVQNLGDPPPPPYSLDDLSLKVPDKRPTEPSTLKHGCTYELRGYESGSYVGVPWEAQGEGGLFMQTSRFGFHVQYVVVSAKQVPAIEFSPKQFIDRRAVLEGTARNDGSRAYLVGTDWRLLVYAASAWPPTMTGKQVAVLSTIRSAGDEPTFRAEQPQASLVNLADQIGQEVRLRGNVRSWNDDWSLVYRGKWVYLGTRAQLAAMKLDAVDGPAVISGLVTEVSIPRNAQLFISREEKKRGKCFTIDVKSWQATDALLSPELGRPTE